MRGPLSLTLLLLALGQVWGCAVTMPYSVYEDKRLVDTITDDKSITASIKTALLQADFTGGWSVSSYCYYGKVFLIGEVPPNMRAKAVEIAKNTKGVRSVTTHWFPPSTGGENNLVLATKLRTHLIGTKGVSSTRVDTQVNAGRVVLLGVVNDEEEKQAIIRAAKETSGVRSVTSYLMFPQ